MRNLVFKSLEIKNFKCHQELDFDFSKNRLVLITGKNGKGKSSLFSALEWVLYSECSNGMTGDSIVRKKSKKDCSVILKFSIDDDEYEIKNYRKHSKFGNSKLLYKNSGILLTYLFKTFFSYKSLTTSILKIPFKKE
jgi:DNA repair exonuclease SbcCD ATPase subunit